MKIYFYLTCLFIVMASSTFSQQDDTCKIWLMDGKNIYELSKIDKINGYRIFGLMSEVLNKKSDIKLFESKKFHGYITTEIQKYFKEHSEIKFENYVLQTIFLIQNNKKYCLSIFQEIKNENNDCFSNRVLSQSGGGNSYFYLIFDLDKSTLIKEKVNGW